MNAALEERAVKLELLASVAHSQRALARMLDCVADTAGASPVLARSIAENIRLLTGLQLSLAESVAGVRLREVRVGVPAPPWLAVPAPIQPVRPPVPDRRSAGRLAGA